MRAAILCALCVALSACRTTVDSLGGGARADGDLEPAELQPLTGPSAYPNAFRDVLGKTDAEIQQKLEQAFQRLFHGDPALEAIYFPMGADQAYIRDTLHDDIRTEGIGYGMLIAVELDKRDEFDRLWRYARAALEYKTGANRGYFQSSCDGLDGTVPCVDPFGHQQFAMALVFAHGRWGSATSLDYEADALALLGVMREKQRENGGVVDGVTDMFDAETRLVLDVPNVAAGGVTRPSIEMPAYYALWAQATGDAFWNDAAARARAHWRLCAHPATGLWPVRARFDGAPVPGWDRFIDEAYRTQLNLVLDRIWTGADAWQLEQSDRLLAFFSSRGIDTYGKAYPLDGSSCLDCSREPSLVAVNGATALVARVPDRALYIDAVWNLEPPSALPRYYAGLLHLLALMALSGNLRVY